MAADTSVRNDADGRRFILTENGSEAELVYRRTPGRLVLVHTEVPESLGGKGIGGRLVRAALDLASSEGLTIVPWCPFARSWLEKHPEAAREVDIDWDSTPSTGDDVRRSGS